MLGVSESVGFSRGFLDVFVIVLIGFGFGGF